MSLFVIGEFSGNAGGILDYKVECDDLKNEQIEGLAAFTIHRLTGLGLAVRSVHGVPSGGLRFAEALRPHCTEEGIDLIVDDVGTTWGSMERARHNWKLSDARGVVMFDRCEPGHPRPDWIFAVCTLTQWRL